jgi:hypothetical protein
MARIERRPLRLAARTRRLRADREPHAKWHEHRRDHDVEATSTGNLLDPDDRSGDEIWQGSDNARRAVRRPICGT